MKKSIVLVLVFLMLVVAAAAASANSKPEIIDFDAAINGSFQITRRVGDVSVLIVIEEEGTGIEGTLGTFDFTSYLFHDDNRPRDGCGPLSTTGVDGSATLTFADGDLRLKRTSAETCFVYPNITVKSEWRIASGTGRYKGATGSLEKNFVGTLPSYTGTGTLIGNIKLH